MYGNGVPKDNDVKVALKRDESSTINLIVNAQIGKNPPKVMIKRKASSSLGRISDVDESKDVMNSAGLRSTD